MESPRHKKKGRKANKIGRNGRADAYRSGRGTGRKGSMALMASRTFSRTLGAYIPRGVALPRDIVPAVAIAAEPVKA